MTPHEFAAACSGFFEFYNEKEKNEWRRTIAGINIHLPKNKKVNAEKILHKNHKPVRIMTQEEARALADKWSKFKKK